MRVIAFTLPAGERELRRWTISRRSFALRCAVLAVVTTLIPGLLVPVQDWWLRPVVAVLTALFYMWVFDDFGIWRDNRHTMWVLTDQALYITGETLGEPVDIRLPLTHIQRIGRLVPWSLVLRLKDRTAITLPLAPRPLQLRKDILAARDGQDKA